MSLAQVVYNISTDNEFASQWNLDPESALADKGLQISREEQGPHRRAQERTIWRQPQSTPVRIGVGASRLDVTKK
jgi:hypothetical protein